jgi:hypothetical protein
MIIILNGLFVLFCINRQLIGVYVFYLQIILAFKQLKFYNIKSFLTMIIKKNILTMEINLLQS